MSVSITSCASAWISSVVSKRRPFSRNFILGNRKKSQGVRSGEWEGEDHFNVFDSPELSNDKRYVNRRVVMVEKPIVFLPPVWTFAPNALPQLLQNLTVKLAIDGLTRGYEFLVDNVLDVGKKTINMDLTLLRTSHTFFSAAVNLATSTVTTATWSQGHNHTPMFHHWL